MTRAPLLLNPKFLCIYKEFRVFPFYIPFQYVWNFCIIEMSYSKKGVVCHTLFIDNK